MKPTPFDIDRLIPHRRPMRLVDDVLEVGRDTAAAAATVDAAWPLTRGGAASPLVLVELAAQTAGIGIGHREQFATGGGSGGMGWLVGIKQASFHLEALPVGARVVVRTASRFQYDGLTEIEATAFVDGARAGDIVLQILRSDPDRGRDPDPERRK